LNKGKSRAVAAVCLSVMSTAAAAIGVAGPAHADPDPQAPVNLPVTDDLRGQLLAAGALLTEHPASDYTGLAPGSTFYAYDPFLDTYWAAATLAGPKNDDAATMLQDANSYMAFRRAGPDGAWIPMAVGFGPSSTMPPGGNCPLPPAVHDLWRLMPGFCHP
jgi:hypothetical protein